MNNSSPIATVELGVSNEASTSRTLPGWAYTDMAVFERERGAIHFKSWHYAGTTQELVEPGSYITAQILGQSVIVVRAKDGLLRGFYNVCQHRAHELVSGRGKVNVITCPYHAWSYKLDGSLSAARGTERLPNFDRTEYSLKEVRIEVFAQKFVFFNLDSDAMPLSQQAAGLAEDIQKEVPTFGQLVVEPGLAKASINANWKATVDNYLECYHCRTAHPALSSLVNLGTFKVDLHAHWMSHKAHLGRPDNAAYPVSPEAVNTRTLWWWLWPTTTFNVLPGSAEISVFSFFPTGVASTLQWGQRFVIPGSPVDEAREQYRNGPLTSEDVSLVESVQRGLNSRGYRSGRFVDDASGGEISERATHLFHRLVADALGL